MAFTYNSTYSYGGRVVAVVAYEINKRGVRVSQEREIGHGCQKCCDYKLIDISDVFPDEASQTVLFQSVPITHVVV
jgi:hypothetical protein